MFEIGEGAFIHVVCKWVKVSAVPCEQITMMSGLPTVIEASFPGQSLLLAFRFLAFFVLVFDGWQFLLDKIEGVM